MIMCYTKQVWRRTEVAVTGLTRNQFTGFAPVRGFESLRLRVFKKREVPLFIGISRFLSSIFSTPYNIYSYIFFCICSTFLLYVQLRYEFVQSRFHSLYSLAFIRYYILQKFL